MAYALAVLIGGRITGWLASGVLLGMVPFLASAGEARVDMVFTAAITVALAAFYAWDARGTAAARVLCYAGIAAAVLAKGPAGAAIPALVIVAFLAVERRLGTLWDLFSWPLVLAALAIDVGWYALAYANGGSAFLHLQLVHENFERVVGGASFHHSERNRYGRMVVSLLAGLLPWSLALAWCGLERLRGVRLDRPAASCTPGGSSCSPSSRSPRESAPSTCSPPARPWPSSRLDSWPRSFAAEDGPARWLDRLPSPERLRRFFAPHPRLAPLALALVVFDLGTLLVLQTVREIRSRPGSLVAFADVVRRTVPENATLLAATSLRRDETLILAYRTARCSPARARAARTGSLLSRSRRGERDAPAGRLRPGGRVPAQARRQRRPDARPLERSSAQVGPPPDGHSERPSAASRGWGPDGLCPLEAKGSPTIQPSRPADEPRPCRFLQRHRRDLQDHRGATRRKTHDRASTKVALDTGMLRHRPSRSSGLWTCALLVGFGMLGATNSSAETGIGRLQLDPHHTVVAFHLAGRLHDIHGTFQVRQGTLEVDPANGAAGGSVVVDATAARAATPRATRAWRASCSRPSTFRTSVSSRRTSTASAHRTARSTPRCTGC